MKEWIHLCLVGIIGGGLFVCAQQLRAGEVKIDQSLCRPLSPRLSSDAHKRLLFQTDEQTLIWRMTKRGTGAASERHVVRKVDESAQQNDNDDDVSRKSFLLKKMSNL